MAHKNLHICPVCIGSSIFSSFSIGLGYLQNTSIINSRVAILIRLSHSFVADCLDTCISASTLHCSDTDSAALQMIKPPYPWCECYK